MMQAMWSGRRRLGGTIVVAVVCGVIPAAAQAPRLSDVMRLAHGFVVEYEGDLSQVVAEEHYEQQVLNGDGNGEQQRVLRSDYWVTQLLPFEFWFGVRDVFEVDGRVVGKRTTRPLRALRLAPGEDATDRLTRIAEDNARYNIGDMVRTFNEPTFVLSFLRPNNRDRMRFVRLDDETLDDVPTWVVGFREVAVDGTSFIGTTDGDPLLTRGRFWIDPTTGRVMRSELITGDGRVDRTARITVDYRWFPSVDLWLPAQMHEVYASTNPRRPFPSITGTATYANYRFLTPAVAALTVAWDPSLDASAEGYIVQWGETSGVYPDARDVGNVTHVRVDRLVEGQRYYFVVRAYTATGATSRRSHETCGEAAVWSGPAR